MSVVHQAVEDAVSDGGIADLLVPARDRQLGSEDGGTSLVAILTDLCLVTILSGFEINNFVGQPAKSVCYNLVAMFDLFRLVPREILALGLDRIAS